MRTKKNWSKRIQPKVLLKFPPRIRKEVMKFAFQKVLIQDTFIFGKVGRGKTLLSARLLLETDKRNYLDGVTDKRECIFISFTELLEEIRNSYSSKEENTGKRLKRYSDCFMLVLDDLGTEKSTDWVLDILYLIVNRRMENDLLTVITSNLDLDELATKLGDDRIPSRISRKYHIIKLKKTYKR